jgi:hypothetical protein
VFFEIVDHQVPHGAVVLDNEDAGRLATFGSTVLVGSGKPLDMVAEANGLITDGWCVAVRRYNCSFYNHLQVLRHHRDRSSNQARDALFGYGIVDRQSLT